MDADRFDSLARTLMDARSRRGALATLLGGTLGLLGLADTAAKKGKGKNKKKKKKNGGDPSPPPPPTDPTAPPASSCSNGQALCDGACVNTATDPRNCGSCGNHCQINASCNSGTCQCNGGSCDAGLQCCASGKPCTGYTVGNYYGFTDPSTCKPIYCPTERQCIGPTYQACCPSGSTCDPSTGTCLQ